MGTTIATKIIAFVAGRSGGHIIPGLTLAERFKKNNQADYVYFFCSKKPLDLQIIASSNYVDAFSALPLQVFPGKKFWHWPAWFISLCQSLYLSISKLRQLKPDKVISLASDVSIPVCMAAYLLRIPIELYELNVVPGKAAKLVAPTAGKIFVTFADCKQYFPSLKTTVVQYPIRYEQPSDISEKIYEEFQLDRAKKTILIVGGSQGSVSVNRYIKNLLTTYPELRATAQFVHQTGSADATDWQSWYRDHNVTAHVFAFSNNLAPLYQIADVIICRAGAGTLFEIAFFDKPCIIIPLEADSTLHQKDNAHAFARQYHRALVLEEAVINRNIDALYRMIKITLSL